MLTRRRYCLSCAYKKKVLPFLCIQEGAPLLRITRSCSQFTHLRIDDHVHALVYDMLGKVIQKVKDMLDHGLIGQPPQPYTVLGGARRDEVLWGMGKLGAQVSVASTS